MIEKIKKAVHTAFLILFTGSVWLSSKASIRSELSLIVDYLMKLICSSITPKSLRICIPTCTTREVKLINIYANMLPSAIEPEDLPGAELEQ